MKMLDIEGIRVTSIHGSAAVTGDIILQDILQLNGHRLKPPLWKKKTITKIKPKGNEELSLTK